MAALTTDTLTYEGMLHSYMPVFYAAFLVTIVLTPVMRMLAHRHGVVDDPDNKRKVHTQPIAYLGGVSIFLGWLAGIGVAVFMHPHNGIGGVQIPPGILLGAMAVVLFGLLDDVYSLSPKMKLLGQFVAALCLLVPGMLQNWSIEIPGFSGTDFLLTPGHGAGWMFEDSLTHYNFFTGAELPGWLFSVVPICSALLVIFIVISACNATNLLDGLDGLCSGVTGVMSMGYLMLALYLARANMAGAQQLDPVRICLSLALLGAVLGFLPFNFNPASIFMGDTGSMFLGFMCATMMLLFGQPGSTRWFLSAIIMFGLPMMDTLLAIVRRKLNRKRIFSPDSGHFHHFLIRSGLSVRQAVLLSYFIAAVFVSFGLVIMVIATHVALGVYLVLFGWIIVAAFKMGMIVQQSPTIANTTINLAVIAKQEREPTEATTGKEGVADEAEEGTESVTPASPGRESPK